MLGPYRKSYNIGTLNKNIEKLYCAVCKLEESGGGGLFGIENQNGDLAVTSANIASGGFTLNSTVNGGLELNGPGPSEPFNVPFIMRNDVGAGNTGFALISGPGFYGTHNAIMRLDIGGNLVLGTGSVGGRLSLTSNGLDVGFILGDDSSVRLPGYSTGNFETGTATHNLSVTSTGSIIKTALIGSADLLPIDHNAYALGSSSQAWTALFLEDTTNGNTYRIEMVNGTLTQTLV